MGKYSLNEVLKRWTQGTLTPEQTIGQVLLLVQDLSERVGHLEKLAEKQRNSQSSIKKGLNQ
ncbi:MAG: hypothetical protein GY943_14320 [Chloroflexi bacterium]|nr:hypothetical protein [Chloroflexota bacterium]